MDQNDEFLLKLADILAVIVDNPGSRVADILTEEEIDYINAFVMGIEE